MKTDIDMLWKTLDEEGKIETLREIIRLDPDQAKVERFGFSLLHIASVRHSVETSMLLDLDADVHQKDDAGRTPLHKAAKASNPETCQLLLNAGADPRVQDNHGRTPLDYAYLGDPEVSEVEYQRTNDLLQRALEAG